MDKKIDIPENALVMMVGIAGVGKTTLAKKRFGEEAVISSDAIRKELYGDEAVQGDPREVFDIFNERIEKRLKNNQLTVADATNLDDMGRRKLYRIASENHRPVYALVFNVPLEVAKRQNELRERKVPEDVLVRQFDQLSNVYHKLQDELPEDHIIDIAVTYERQEELKNQKDER